MYSFLSSISQILSSPFVILLNETKQLPLLAAFFLGLVGALAPCQLTGNISAITYYGNKSLQTKKQWFEACFFILGKVVAFSCLGLAVWIIGRGFQTSITSFFAFFRKLMGPFIILLGLFLLGIIKLNLLNRLFTFMPKLTMGGLWSSFLMGVSFSIAFCPTMFVLFFLTLMPIVLITSYGAILPTIFAIGTSLPLIVFLLIIWSLGFDGSLMKKSRKIGLIVQKSAGFLLIMMGIFDTITYW
ncbi:sulfite exporter TauE/SafE family protein [Neobacillus sp. PS3-12]|jgi:cytochrome c-type biogenesis protein|uniref:urease accessory protein UreH domain-containing protein n=1 Tax=Neobacillus sp. PS3-12 TaxID=3070677 RepID=UPI0027DFCABE|nr:sulfite exporter TauE/SafE family protein [Neobacillus sp. PS3-12]WML53731.1 sulfite exporter TauE/SafE family protein [Neobacillus sp. PS3-12]